MSLVVKQEHTRKFGAPNAELAKRTMMMSRRQLLLLRLYSRRSRLISPNKTLIVYHSATDDGSGGSLLKQAESVKISAAPLNVSGRRQVTF